MLADQVFEARPGTIDIGFAGREEIIMGHDLQGEAARAEIPEDIEEADAVIFESVMGAEALLEAKTGQFSAAFLHCGRPGSEDESEDGDHDCQSERVHGISLTVDLRDVLLQGEVRKEGNRPESGRGKGWNCRSNGDEKERVSSEGREKAGNVVAFGDGDASGRLYGLAFGDADLHGRGADGCSGTLCE